MNKFMKSFVILAVIAIAFGSVSAVFAQSGTPEGAGSRFGKGNLTQRGGRGAGAGPLGEQDGVLHESLIAAYAAELGISVEDLEARLADGETMAQIALSTGLTIEEFKSLMQDVRALALDQAVLDGTLSAEQAEWLKTRGGGRGSIAGRQGRNQRLNGTGECPYNQ